MENEIKIVKNWWLLTLLGILTTLLGIWIYLNPSENYVALSIIFSVIIFISGIFEIVFAISNSKIIRSWGWILTSGIFDLIIGIILVTKENLTMEILPVIFGIWLIFGGVSQIGKGLLFKESHLPNWGWPVVGGVLIALFGFFVIYSPAFGAWSIVIWTSLSLILLGIMTIIFSLFIKKIHTSTRDF